MDPNKQQANDLVRQLVTESTPAWNAPIGVWPTREMETRLQTLAAQVFDQLPPIPSGYYVSPCSDPDSACTGWHIYMHGGWYKDLSGLDGYLPTGQHYCDGQSALTLAWLAGQLAPWEEEIGQTPKLIDGRPVTDFIGL